uniref:Putative secreted protein n=1 Tax=Anopheles marajoara TaxID=58244 RepID=A0A2M4CCT3_9DIPT
MMMRMVMLRSMWSTVLLLLIRKQQRYDGILRRNLGDLGFVVLQTGRLVRLQLHRSHIVRRLFALVRLQVVVVVLR